MARRTGKIMLPREGRKMSDGYQLWINCQEVRGEILGVFGDKVMVEYDFEDETPALAQ